MRNSLGVGLLGPEEAAWHIVHSWNTRNPLMFSVNAATGQCMTDIESIHWDSEALPFSYDVSQDCSNPFNSTTDVRYLIPHGRFPIHTTLEMCTVLGREVRALVKEVQEPKYDTVSWDGRDEDGFEVSSGIYSCGVRVRRFTDSKRTVLLR